MSKEEFVKRKMRQLVCQNSPELRELERHLQTAYNRYILEGIIINKKADRLKDKDLERQLALREDNLRVQEEMRLRELQHNEKIMKLEVANVLKHQMLDKRKHLEEEMNISALEAKAMEERIKQEKAEENKISLQMKCQRYRFREQQEELHRYRELLKLEDKKATTMVEQEILKEMLKKANAEAEIVAIRQKRIEATEKVKEIIAANLEEEERLKHEAEELSIKLLCAEREEKERIQEEEEFRLRMQRRQASKQSFDDIARERLLKKREEQEIEIIYSANLRKSLELEEMRQRQEDERCRRGRMAVRSDNYRLMQWKMERKRAAQAEKLAEDAAVITEEVARCKIVEEEKLQLLRSIDRQILDLLPPGCLTEEDMINLNIVK